MKHNIITLLLAVLVTSITNAQKLQKHYESLSKYSAQKEWKKAMIPLDSLLELDPKNNYWLIEKSKIESLLENHDEANNYLIKSIKNGYRNLSHIEKSEAFNNIRNTPQFKETVQDLINELSQYQLNKGEQDIVISVPPMLECYVIMLYLGNSKHPLINSRREHAYFKRIDDYFSKYKTHAALVKLREQYPGNKEDWINNLRAHHNLRTLYAYDGLNIDKIVKFPVEIDFDLAKTVKEFAEASNFMSFYKENKEFYRAMEKVMTTNYSFGSKIIPFFNANFEKRINRFNIYFSPIYGGWQHGPKVAIGDYIECFYFGGIMYTNKKHFYYPDVNLLFTFITEFDHTPINALTSKFQSELLSLKDQVSKLNKTGHVSYGSIISTVNEYLTWAFALQFFYEQTPDEYEALKTNIITTMEKYRGFIKFEDFMDFYEQYITNRDKYPMLKDFYPEVIKWIKNI